MKIATCSDLHLEFGDLVLTNEQNADVLVLSGDIFVAEDLKMPLASVSSELTKSEKIHKFITRCTKEFSHVVYVMGNHEHYHGDFAETAKIIRQSFADLDNFHFLDKEWVIINDVLFFGGTLWTDMNKEDPNTMASIRGYMNDYRIIKNTAVGPTCKFIPLDSVYEHKEFLHKLDEVLELHSSLPVVVVGHHAPSKASTHPRYVKDVLVNGAYSSNLDEFILDRRQIKLWTHGHTHEPFDYMIGTTRIVCNPRGYINYEECADFFELKYVEI